MRMPNYGVEILKTRIEKVKNSFYFYFVVSAIAGLIGVIIIIHFFVEDGLKFYLELFFKKGFFTLKNSVSFLRMTTHNMQWKLLMPFGNGTQQSIQL